MLRLAARGARQEQVPFRLYHGDARNLKRLRSFPDEAEATFPDASFDVVLSAGMLEYAGLEAATELRRVLKPGGQLILCIIRDTLVGRLSSKLWKFNLLSPSELERTLGMTLTARAVPSPNAYLQQLKLVLEGKKS